MSGEKFTPGPWHLEAGETLKIVCNKGSKIANAVFVWLTGRRTEEEAKANAHLIAAAPELYDELKKAIRYIPEEVMYCNGMKCRETWCGSCNDEDDAEMEVGAAQARLRKIRAALAKARGEVPQ